MLQMPGGREASGDGGSVGYERHRPERTLLYQLVEEYYPAFEAQWAAECKVINCIEDPVVIEKILTHLNLTTPAVQAPLPNSRAPPQTEVDPVFRTVL